MIGLLQRVTAAAVHVDGDEIARIGTGLLVLVGVQREDTDRDAARLAERLLGYRVFPDEEGRMNRSVTDIGGDILLVPQFTLAANTRKGTRASFTSAAPPAEGRRLFHRLAEDMAAAHGRIATGVFGADMQVSLINSGPVTFWLET
ncbi:MAG: D-aminoacyl-tRNA deacylase [Gammaproteobacteria bacterium]|jgi:D-tyrosyl-tRNA(Tyr) deacylase